MEEDSTNMIIIAAATMGLAMLLLMGMAVVGPQAFYMLRNLSQNQQTINTITEILKDIFMYTISTIAIVTGLFFGKLYSKKFYGLLKYHQWINYDKKIFSSINKDVKSIPYKRNSYRINPTFYFYKISPNQFNNELVTYQFHETDDQFIKETKQEISLVDGIKAYQNYGEFFYKNVDMTKENINEKLTKLTMINNYLKIASHINMINNQTTKQLKEKELFIKKQLEEIIMLFNSTMLNEKFNTKYLQLHDSNSIKINYKINEILQENI